MEDLGIVGGGYWGTAAALVAQGKGLSATIFDCAKPAAASTAASGYFAEGWYSGVWKQRMMRARALAESHGVRLKNTGAQVYGLKDRSTPRFRQDWHTFDPRQFLELAPVGQGHRVTSVGPGFVQTTADRFAFKHVLVVAGTWTDELLQASNLPPMGVKSLAGSAVVVKDSPTEVRLHEVTPYNQIALREWGPGLMRICATQEKKPNQSREYVQKMLERVKPYTGPDPIRVSSYYGLRPLLEGGPDVRLVAPGVVAATGGGRIGGLMSFWAAEQALRELGLA